MAPFCSYRSPTCRRGILERRGPHLSRHTISRRRTVLFISRHPVPWSNVYIGIVEEVTSVRVLIIRILGRSNLQHALLHRNVLNFVILLELRVPTNDTAKVLERMVEIIRKDVLVLYIELARVLNGRCRIPFNEHVVT